MSENRRGGFFWTHTVHAIMLSRAKSQVSAFIWPRNSYQH